LSYRYAKADKRQALKQVRTFVTFPGLAVGRPSATFRTKSSVVVLSLVALLIASSSKTSGLSIADRRRGTFWKNDADASPIHSVHENAFRIAIDHKEF
jgi:hypothetical protein